MKSPSPPLTGAADLRLGRRRVKVEYAYREDSGRGFLTGPPDVMAEAFRRGEASLVETERQTLRLRLIGYTAGSCTAYFELILDRRVSTSLLSPHAIGFGAPKRAPNTF